MWTSPGETEAKGDALLQRLKSNEKGTVLMGTNWVAVMGGGQPRGVRLAVQLPRKLERCGDSSDVITQALNTLPHAMMAESDTFNLTPRHSITNSR
jgi:hypothetical protein